MENKEKQIIENVEMFQQLDLLRKIKREFDTYINFYITIIEEFMEYNLTCEEIEMKIDEHQTVEEKIKTIETQFDKLYETNIRSKTIIEFGEKIETKFNEFRVLQSEYSSLCSNMGEKTAVELNNMLKILKDFEIQRKPKERDMKIHQRDNFERFLDETFDKYEIKTKNILEQKEKDKIKEQEEMMNNFEKFTEKKTKEIEQQKENERYDKVKEMISKDLMDRLEKHSNKWIDDVVFDSMKHSWNRNKSDFANKILNKSNVYILIETSDEIIGCYIENTINELDKYIEDENAFIFTFNQQKGIKFKIKDKSKAIKICRNEDEALFKVGQYKGIFRGEYADILVKKEEKNKSFGTCDQSSFEYNGKSKALVNKNEFNVKRIFVIQMVEKRGIMIKNVLIEYEKKDYNEELEKNDRFIIEEWCDIFFEKKVFDSDVDDWSVVTSSFYKKIYGRENLVFLIEDDQNNTFGVFIKSKIDKFLIKQNNVWVGERIEDENAFIFSLRSNGRLHRPMKFDLIKENKDIVFSLFNSYSEMLFGIGGESDIVVMKKNYKNECRCIQNAFDYKGYENVLIGKSGIEKPWTVQRIRVYQMYETEELRKEIEALKKERKYAKERELEKTTEETARRMVKEKEQLEEWTDLEFESVIFDSRLHTMNWNDSEFDKRIFGKEKLVFMIRDTEGNVFGAFINALINKYDKFDENKEKIENAKETFIKDNKAFIFSFKSNNRMKEPTKFDILPKRSDFAFVLFREKNDILFDIGGLDICVSKNSSENSFVTCIQNTFNYNGNNNVLNGKISNNENQKTTQLESLQVWQMAETYQSKRKIEIQMEQIEKEKNEKIQLLSKQLKEQQPGAEFCEYEFANRRM